jgi:tetratricopeptide (TPR) repeat protein
MKQWLNQALKTQRISFYMNERKNSDARSTSSRSGSGGIRLLGTIFLVGAFMIGIASHTEASTLRYGESLPASLPGNTSAILLHTASHTAPSSSSNALLVASSYQRSIIQLPFQVIGSDTSAVNIGLALLLPDVINTMLAVYPVVEEAWIEHSHRLLFPNEKSLRNWIAGTVPYPKDELEELFRHRYVLYGTLKFDQKDKADKTKLPAVELILLDRQTANQVTKPVPLDLPSLVEFQKGVISLLDDIGLGVSVSEQSRMIWKEELPKPALDAVCKQYTLAAKLDYSATSAEQALKAAKEAVAASPKSYIALTNYGNMLLVADFQKNVEIAKKQFLQAISIHQNGYVAATGLYNIALAVGDDESLKSWAIRRATMQSKSGDATLAEFYAAQAKSAAAKKNYGRAAELYLKAQEFNNSVRYTRNSARMLALAGNINKAEQILRAALQSTDVPRDREELQRGLAEIWSDRAVNFWERFHNTNEYSDLGAALASYKRSLDELYVPITAAQYIFAHSYLLNVSHATIADSLQVLTQQALTRLNTRQERRRFSLELARLLHSHAANIMAQAVVSKYDLAETMLRRATALDGDDFTYVYNLLSMLVHRQGKLDDASTLIEVVSKAWQSDQPKMALLTMWRGLIAAKKQDFSTAITLARQSVAMSPDCYPCLEALGKTCIEAKRYAEAIPPLERRVLKDSSSADVFHLIGISYFQLKNMTKSRQALQKSLMLNTKRNPATLELARVLALQKEYNEALKMLELALQENLATISEVDADTSFDVLRTNPEYAKLRGKYR